jgi:glycosyltransferase involved in cell wall biosynthesis
MSRRRRSSVSDRLAIVGGYPPPFGGVATHVRRLRQYLETAKVDYVIYNTVSEADSGGQVVSVAANRGRWLLRYVLTPERCTYFVSARLPVWIAGALIGLRPNRFVAVRLQNSALAERVGRGVFWRVMMGTVLRRFDRVVCVNEELATVARELGVDAARIRCFPGYLPPGPDEFSETAVSDGVWSFIEGRAPILCASGRVSWYRGVDTYGFDVLVDLLGRLAEDLPDVALVVCLWDYDAATDEERLKELMERSQALGVDGQIYFNRERGGFLPVIARSDVLLRPTATDGDANSVREALALGVPVVASDVVARPEGTITVPARDVEAMASAVHRALDGGRRRPATDSGPDQRRAEDYLDELKAWVSASC